MDHLLAQAGSHKPPLLSGKTWVIDRKNCSAVNNVWVSWIDAENLSVGVCVHADLVTPDYKARIKITAVN